MKNLITQHYSKEKLAFFKQENNPNVDLETLTKGSRKEITWTCKNNHNFIKKVSDFSRPTGTSCPTCRNEHNSVFDSKLKKNFHLIILSIQKM